MSYNNYISWSIQMINYNSGKKNTRFSLFSLTNSPSSKYITFYRQQILTFEKLGPTNVWHFEKCVVVVVKVVD